MSIGVAEFNAWLRRDDVRRLVLVELKYAYENAGAPALGTVYLSTGVYATESTDTPASTSYIDAILDAPRYSRALDVDTLGGRAPVSIGTLELDNTDGSLDYLLDLVIDGHEVRMSLGDAAWDRGDFRPMLIAQAVRFRGNHERLTLILRDRSVLINDRVGGEPIGGTGPNAGRRRPLILGVPHQVEGLLADTANVRYYVGSDLVGATLADVRDSGLSLGGSPVIAGDNTAMPWNTSTDRIEYTAHGFIDEDVVRLTRNTAGTLPTTTPQVAIDGLYWVVNKTANDFQIATTRGGTPIDITATGAAELAFTSVGYYPNNDGSIDLAHPPVGRVTVDYAVPPTAAPLYHSDAMLYLIENISALQAKTDNTPYWLGPHASAPTTGTSLENPSIGMVISEPTNVLDLIDEMLVAINGFWAFGRLGTFYYGRILTATTTSKLDINEDDIIGAVEIDHVEPSYWRVSCLHNKNWTRQTDGFALAVPPESVARFAGPGLVTRTAAPSGTTYAGDPTLYHLTIVDSPEIETVIASANDITSANYASTWAVARQSQRFPHLEVVRLTTRLTAWAIEIGDAVTLTTRLWGFDAGELFQVIGIDVSLTDDRIDLTLIRPRGPGYSGFPLIIGAGDGLAESVATSAAVGDTAGASIEPGVGFSGGTATSTAVGASTAAAVGASAATTTSVAHPPSAYPTFSVDFITQASYDTMNGAVSNINIYYSPTNGHQPLMQVSITDPLPSALNNFLWNADSSPPWVSFYTQDGDGNNPPAFGFEILQDGSFTETVVMTPTLLGQPYGPTITIQVEP